MHLFTGNFIAIGIIVILVILYFSTIFPDDRPSISVHNATYLDRGMVQVHNYTKVFLV